MIIGAKLKLLSQLLAFFVCIRVLLLLFIQLLVESTNFILFCNEHLLEGSNLSVVAVSLLLLVV